MSLTDADLDQALASFEEFLRSKRLKMTDQRRTMIRAALENRAHFTAEELYQKLNGAGAQVSIATVYRGLSLLEEAGLIEGHDFADGQRRYERSMDREHHDHMICVDCRAVIEFTSERIEKLQEEIVADHGFSLQDHSLTLFVKCNALRQTGACERREGANGHEKASGG